MGRMVYTPAEAAEWLPDKTANDVKEMIEAGEIGFFLNGKPFVNGDELYRYINREKKDAKGRKTIREVGR